jgi:EmrB/QacA subfamily drug resistance transporter
MSLRRVEYKWIVGIVFVFGLFMDLLDMTIVNVAVPTLATEFHATTTSIQWVVTGYLLSLAVFIPVSGWAGDRFGTKRVFMFALAMFVTASLLCGLAWNIETLIAFRVLQGVGGGMLTPVGTAMIFRAFPPAERALASALLAIPAVVAPATGPVLGGYLVEYQNWRAIFFVNIPIGLLGLLVAGLYLREDKQENTGRLDVPGFVLSATGLASVVYALAEAGQRGFDDPRVLLFGAGGISLLAAFALVELRTPQPMIDMRLFKNRLFRAASAVQLMGQAGLGGALFLLPLFLQLERGMTPLQSGLTTFPQAIGVVTMVQPAGRIYRRYGPRRMMMAGTIGTALSSLMLAVVGLETGAWWIRMIMLFRGWSFALMLIPLQTATFATIASQDTGRASAVFNAVRQVAASLGVALMATTLTNRLAHNGATLGNPLTSSGAVHAFHEAYIVAALLSVIGFFACFLISDRDAAGTMALRSPQPVPEAAEAVPAGAQ